MIQRRTYYFLGVVICLTFALPLKGQSPAPSSLNNIEHLIEEGELLARKGERDSSQILLQRTLHLSKLLSPIAKTKALLALANHHYTFMQYDSARVYNERAFILADENELKLELAEANWLKGMLYFRKFEYILALEHCEQAQQTAKELDNKKLEGKCLICIGSTLRTYHNTPKFEEAIVYYEQAKSIFSSVKDTANLAYSMLILVDMYHSDFYQGKYDDNVETYFNEVQSLLSIFRHDQAKIVMLNVGSALSSAKGQSEATLNQLLEALNLSESMGLDRMTQHVYIRIFDHYLEQEDYDNAKSSLDMAIEVYPEFMPAGGAELYVGLYKKMGDFESAFEYLEKQNQFVDSISRKEQVEKVSEWETKYKTKERELLLAQNQEELSSKQEQNRFLILVTLFSLLAVGGIVIGFLIQLRAKKKLRGQKKIIEQQAEELRQLDRLKSRFFANVSHELRTPLTLILGPLSTLLKSNKAQTKELKLLNLMQQNGRNLLKLVNEILDLSKLESNQLLLKEEAVVLSSLFHRQVSQFESLAQQNQIQLLLQFLADEYLTVLLDKEKFEKVINNFLSNALKFTPKGGMVNVSLNDLTHAIQLKVEDTGLGIHSDDLPYIFNRFYQSKLPDAPTQGGTGIGLALCQEFAQLFKGKTWAESEPGKGSCFYFEFPKKEVMGAPDLEDDWSQEKPNSPTSPVLIVENEAQSNPEKQPTILLVEDNPSLREYIHLVLQDQYHIITAENGQVALEQLTAHLLPSTPYPLPDLIISDIMMPVMDGFQLLEVLKNKDEFRHLPVIMLTARAALDDKLKALRIGVDDYMTKPFETEELLARVSNLLINSRERKNLQADVTETEKIAEVLLTSQAEQEWLEQLEHQVKVQIGNPNFNLIQLAQDLFISERQMHRKIKKLTGLTPNKYIREIKLQKARELLESRTYQTVLEASYAVGFSKPEYFSKLYHQRFGKLPSAYMV